MSNIYIKIELQKKKYFFSFMFDSYYLVYIFDPQFGEVAQAVRASDS